MRKTPFILLAGVVAALILGDVIEIQFHSEKLAGVPQALATTAKDGSIYEKMRASVTHGKRFGEQFFIKDARQRYEIALGYVEKDSERLRHLSENKGSEQPEKLGPQTRLLEESLAHVKEESEHVSVDDLVSLKDKSLTAFATAEETLQTAHELAGYFESVKNRLTEVKTALEAQIGKFRKTDEESGDVAGAQSENTENPEAGDIPLKF